MSRQPVGDALGRTLETRILLSMMGMQAAAAPRHEPAGRCGRWFLKEKILQKEDASGPRKSGVSLQQSWVSGGPQPQEAPG